MTLTLSIILGILLGIVIGNNVFYRYKNKLITILLKSIILKLNIKEVKIDGKVIASAEKYDIKAYKDVSDSIEIITYEK